MSNIPPGDGHVGADEAEGLRRQVVSILGSGVERVLKYDTLRAALLEAQPGLASGGRAFVLAIGKAALSMSRVAVEYVPRVEAAAIVVPHGYREAWQTSVPWGPRATLLEAGHPLPDEASAAASDFLGRLLAATTVDDQVIVLVSGGGSALVGAPIPGISEAAYREVLSRLYVSGRPIGEVNAIRRGISRLAGGGLARACYPARVNTFILSDVPGDEPCIVASGPTCCPTLPDIAASRAQVELMFGDDVARIVEEAMLERANVAGQSVINTLVGSNADAVEGVLRACNEFGIRATPARRMSGEARSVGEQLAEDAVGELSVGEALVFGGETTVTVRGDGRGGRCQELVVAAASALERHSCRAIIGCLGTDGRDGPTDAAGAVVAVAPGTTRWRELAPAALENNDTYPVLEKAGALVFTGPTHTNVMDIGVLLMIS